MKLPHLETLTHRIFFFTLVVLAGKGELSAQTSPPVLQGIFGGGTLELGQRTTLWVPVDGLMFNQTPVGYTFQWRKDGAILAGATTWTHEILAAAEADAGTYAVTVTNAAGSSVATASVALKPAAPPVITQQPRDQVVQAGQSAIFTFTATGSYPRTYQWRKDGADIAGATSAFLSLSGVTTENAGAYSVVVSNSHGSATSTAAALTVNAATPPAFYADSPHDATCVHGTYITIYVSMSAGSTPITYQWWKDGAPLAGATDGHLTFSAIAPADAGKYRLVATNAGGSATSREATISVTPATPITIGRQPAAKTIFQGQSATLDVWPSAGSQPITYQWRKNGTPITGATKEYLSFSAAAVADSGDYSVVLTNAAGTVTSEAAKLTVSPAVKPTVTRQPENATVPYHGTVNLSVQVSGSDPMTLEWKRDGIAVGGGTSLWLSRAVPANSGVYTLTATNAAGSVTSNAVTVVVQDAIPAVVTDHPKSVDVAEGMDAEIRFAYTAVGAGDVSVEWRKNGVAVPPGPFGNNQSTSMGFSRVAPSDAGVYTAVISGPGGKVTTASARLAVLPPIAPYLESPWGWPSTEFGNPGETKQWSLYSVKGSQPQTIQWFKDGAPIANATSSTLYVSNLKEADYGVYTVSVRNAGGLISSPPFELRPYDPTAEPWRAAERFGDVVYFLARSPSRIERYDLAAESWLASVALTNETLPTAMLPTADGVYLAYGRALVRRTLDLTNEVPILNAVSDIVSLFESDQFVYYTAYVGPTNSTVYATRSFHRGTLAEGNTLAAAAHLGVFAPGKRLLYGAYDYGSHPRVFRTDAEGRLATPHIDTYDAIHPTGGRLYLFPGEEFVANRGGTVYRLDTLTYAGSVGRRIADLAFFADGTPVVVRDRKVHRVHPTLFRNTGEAMLPFRGLRAFTKDTNVFVFGGGIEGSAFEIAKIAANAMTPPVPTAPTITPDEFYSVDDIFLGDDGVVHLYSRSEQAVLRWSSATRTFLTPTPLRALPRLSSQSDGAKRALFYYNDGQITELPLRASAASESQVAVLGHGLIRITDLGDGLMLNAQLGLYDSENLRMTFDANGAPTFTSASGSWRFGSAWDPIGRRLYNGRFWGHDDGTLRYEVVPLNGALAGSPDSALASIDNVSPPLRFNAAEGLFATGNGRVLNRDLVQTGVLSNDILDAAWLPDNLYTLRSKQSQTEVQRWSRSTHFQNGAAVLPGTPLRIFRLDDTTLVVVTQVLGHPFFSVLNPDLTAVNAAQQTPQFTTEPVSQAVAPQSNVTLNVGAVATNGPATYRWLKNGAWIAGEVGTTLTLTDVQPSTAGLYSSSLTTQVANACSDPAIIGLASAEKVIGDGSEVGPDIRHPNGNIYDQILLEGTAASVAADSRQVLRMSYIDLSNDIVQVEFSGAGTLSLVLEGATGPAAPTNYVQPSISYMKGHARIVITGADESTNVTVFTVGTATALNQTLFRSDVDYDGIADLASIAILSRNGKFGGIRAANAHFFSTTGLTGIYAPGVEFEGPVYVGDISGTDAAEPAFVVGSASDVRIAGGTLAQVNGRAVKVGSVVTLSFTLGSTSHGESVPAGTNAARFERDGIDVTPEMTGFEN